MNNSWTDEDAKKARREGVDIDKLMEIEYNKIQNEKKEIAESKLSLPDPPELSTESKILRLLGFSIGTTLGVLFLVFLIAVICNVILYIGSLFQ